MTLRDCPVGAPVRVTAVRATPERRLRLAELGLLPGATLTVVRRTVLGARVVALRHARLGLDAATAASLEVVPA